MSLMHRDDADLNLLRALDVLLEERHVSRSATRLHLTQPAMSRTLGRLRKTFNDELLVRTASGYVLTPRARWLQNELAELLPRLRLLIGGETFDPATASGTMRLAASDYLLTALGDTLFPAFLREAPRMSLRIEPVTPTTFEDVDRGRVDIALLPITPPAPLRRHVLFTDEFVCLMCHNHPLACDRLTLDDVGSYPHVRVEVLGSNRMLVERRLDQLGIQPFARLTVPYFHGAAAALPGSELIAILPRRIAVACRGPALRIAELPTEISAYEYPMVWHPRLTDDPTHRWMRSLLLEASSTFGK